MAERSWVEDAACRRLPTRLIPLFLADHDDRSTQAHEAAEARKVCEECPVRAQCLQAALDANITIGVWGGLTPRARRDKAAVNAVLHPQTQTTGDGQIDGESAAAADGEQ